MRKMRRHRDGVPAAEVREPG